MPALRWLIRRNQQNKSACAGRTPPVGCAIHRTVPLGEEETLMFLHERFWEKAQQLPEAVAFSFGAVSCTYGACAARVERLAAALAARLPRDTRVALNLYKSIDAIVLMLA